MQFSSRFTIAVHILLAVNEFDGQCKTTSFFLGNSVNVNPVIIRKTLGQLKDAGLVTVEAGPTPIARWERIFTRSWTAACGSSSVTCRRIWMT